MPGAAAKTLLDCFLHNAEACPNKAALIYLAEGEREGERLTYGEWFRWSAAIACKLVKGSDPGGPVLLPMDTGCDFLAGFVGAMLAGRLVVPLPPPTGRAGWRRFCSVAQDCGARTVLIRSCDLDRARAKPEVADFFSSHDCVTTDEAGSTFDGRFSGVRARSENPAFLQYTSGSTGTPKGVVVTHANLLHNERHICHSMGNHADSVFLTWLPLFHDMGLICSALQSLYLGTTCYLMSPASFIQRPIRWLDTISRFGVTSTGGPNFAYDLCVEKATALEPGSLDLSRWDLAFNGAEPVRAKTIRAFTETFRPHGFRAEAFYCGYGLAEGTLLVSGGRSDAGPRISGFDEQSLALGYARPAAGADAVELVECGKGPAGQDLRIISPSSGCPLPNGEIGEIWIRSESVAAGYWNRPGATQETFGARTSEPDSRSYLRTGDLGFLYDGGLYICGRVRDLIVIRGMNHYPQDIEYTVEAAHPDLMAHGSAAFAVSRDGREELVIVAELTRAGCRRSNAAEVLSAIRRAVASEHELVAHAIALVRPGALPKTTSGKVQRSACRTAWCKNELSVVASQCAPLGHAAGEATFAAEIARIIQCDGVELEDDQPLTSYGLDSLAAMRLQDLIQSRYGHSISLAEILDGITLSSLRERLNTSAPSGPEQLTLDVSDLACAHNQRSLWLHHQRRPESRAYYLSAAFVLEGRLDEGALGAAFENIVARHDGIRSTFFDRDGRIERRISGVDRNCFKRLALSPEQAIAIPFDLSSGPLVRGFLVGEPDRRVLVISAHHIVLDLWSFTLLMADLGGAYCRLTGQAGAAEIPASGYGGFVALQTGLITSERGKRMREYWRDRCAAMPAPFQLPGARSARDDREVGAVLITKLGPERTAGIKAIARELAVTPFVVMLSAFRVALDTVGCERTGVLGLTTSGRHRPELRQLIGYTVNVLPLTLKANPRAPFRQLVREIQQETAPVLEHCEFPLQLILEDPELNFSEPPFRIAFVYQQMPIGPGLSPAILRQAGGEVQWGELRLRSLELPTQGAPFDLNFSAIETGDEFSIAAEYRTAVYDGDDIRRLNDAFVRVVDQALASPDQAAVCATEPWVSTAAPQLAPFLPVHAAFERNAEVWPNRTAILAEERNVTYGELYSRSTQIAASLRAAGAGPGGIVATLLRRSEGAVAAMLGILKSGNAYTPLAPDWPKERIATVLEDCQPVCVVTCRELLTRLPQRFQANAVVIDELSYSGRTTSSADPQPIHPNQPAYILYTSGTTGRPKGVVVTHANLAGYISWASEHYLTKDSEVFALFTSLAFDLTVTSIFAPLVSGNAIAVFQDGLEESALIQEALRHPAVTVVKATPSHLRLALSLSPFRSSVHTLIVGGEALDTNLARDITAMLGSGVKIYNEYGPTEATVGCIVHTYDPVRDTGRDVPIGMPVAGARVYLLNEDLEPAPNGTKGELFLAGPCVADGYRNRPSQTAMAFLPEPGGGGARMYRTGDLARMLPDGTLDYLGRRDDQIKWRGVRIEPREINHRLGKYPGIRECVVALVPGPTGTDVLCAYYTSDGPYPSNSLRCFLSDSFPENMLPVFFMHMEKLPLSANGKVARNALPAPRAESEAIPPRTPQETTVYEVWREVLGFDGFGVTDPFPFLGGDSINAMRVVTALSKRGLSVRVRDIFEHGTIERIARLAVPVPKIARVGRDCRAHEQKSLTFPMAEWFFAQDLPRPQHYHHIATLTCPDDPQPVLLRRALAAVYRQHDSLRLTAEPGGRKLRVNDPGTDGALSLRSVDLAGLAELAARSEQARLIDESCADTDLKRGPLLQALLFRMPSGWELVVCCHHLAIDAVSWRIFTDDLSAAYDALCRGEEPQFEPSGCLFDWANRLESLAGGPKFERLLTPGIHRETLTISRPVCHKGGEATETLLLAALTRALQAVTESTRLDVEMEDHGRNFEELDVSRTMGWMTSLYTVAVSFPNPGANPKAWLSSIRDQRRAAPRQVTGGIHTPAAARLNYLGEWPSSPRRAFQIDPTRSYLSSAPENPPSAELELNVHSIGERLHLQVSYHTASWPPADRSRFVEVFSESLRSLEEASEKAEVDDHREMHFETAGLSTSELDALLA